MTSVFEDLTYAFRALRANPGFAVAVIVSVALGIAANTTVFTLVKATLLGSLPVPEADRLVTLDEGKSKSYPDYADYRDQTDVFDGVAAYFPLTPASIGGGEPERIWGQLVTGNYFAVIGVRPALGRGILPEEDKVAGRDPVVVLSSGLWRRRFGGDPGILGRQVILNSRPFTVVGVAPAGFHGDARGIVSEFWVPLAMTGQIMPDLVTDGDPITQRDNSWLSLVARLKPGVSRQQAQAAVNVVKRRIDQTYKRTEERGEAMRLTDAGGMPGGSLTSVAALMAVLMVIVGLVLLIACANVANLLLARGAARRKEIGIRLAIGASRGRLIRQFLTESLLLAVGGAGLGFLLSQAATRSIAALQLSLPFPIAFNFAPDARVLAFTAGLAVLTGVLFGLAPALRATRPDLVTNLKDDASLSDAGRRFGMRNLLVVAQMAMSLVLLISAGLFLRSLGNASSIDIGMQPQGVAVMAVDPKLHNYSTDRSRQFVSQLRQRLNGVPGVTSVSFVDVVPLSLGGHSTRVSAAPHETYVDIYRVGTRYFETMGIPMRRGRDFTPSVGSENAVILNEIAAAKLFPGAEAVGREIRDHGKSYQVIAVVGGTKSRTLSENPTPCIYHFLEADPNQILSFFGLAVLVRTTGNPGAIMRPVRAEIHALDPNLAVFNAETMQEHIEKAMLLPRLSASLLGVFGVAGLALATVGLYGVMSYSVRRRSREIGIRMALGAPASGVLRMVIGQGMVLAGTGAAIGLAFALALSQFTASLLYGIGATDAVTFIGVPAVLILVAFAATLLPARRASHTDPWIALHYE